MLGAPPHSAHHQDQVASPPTSYVEYSKSICRPGRGGPAEDPFHSLTEICHQASCLQWGQGTGNGTWGQSSVPTCQLNWKLTLPLRKKIPVP